MHFKLQTRIVGYFTILLLLVIGVFAAFFDIVVSRRFESMMNREVVQLAMKVSQHVDSYLLEMDQVSKSFATNGTVLGILRDVAQNGPPQSGYTRLLYSRALDDTFASALAVTSIPSSSVYLYSKGGTYSHAFNDRASDFSAIMKSPANRRIFENSNWILQPALSDVPNQGPTRLISLVRPINSLNGIEYGYIEVQNDYSELQKICDVGSMGQVIILDAQGREVYPLERVRGLDVSLLTPRNADNQSGTLVLPHGKLYAYAWSDYTGYTVFVKERAGTVLAPLIYLRNATYGTVLAVTLFALAMVYVISLVLMKPIRELRDSVVQVNLENLELDIDDHAYVDEVQLLHRAFQDMLKRLRTSLERTMILNREEMNARFAALQARIAPHFIHNVLYIISILAHEKRTDDAELACKRLSDMLRYVVRSPTETVTLEDEIAYTLDYLSLQKQIYDDFLSYSVAIAPEARWVSVPRLVIQPFVENSIHNGFKNRLPPWKVDVKCEVQEERWSITIADNGCGIDEKTIRTLLDMTSAAQIEPGFQASRASADIEGMAIMNTYSRLRLLYGELLGFEIRSSQEGGTTVRISGPAGSTAR